MAGSPAFARIERDVLRLIDSIPAGRFSSFELIGAAIDAPARHVAYFISRQSEGLRIESQAVVDQDLCFTPQAATFAKAAPSQMRVERATRPAEHRRSAQGEPVLFELHNDGCGGRCRLALDCRERSS